MADPRRFAITPQFDIEQLVREAQHRWLRPVEICEILRNHHKFRIAPEPPNRPPSGSLFLFDRKVLRYFRKDCHNWRKKKDGKTVKEAHERLKAESIDVLHCYYAHGEENENFQRRTYWMLEESFMHIVLVHYLEIKGNKASYSRNRDVEDLRHAGPVDSPSCSSSFTNENQLSSQTMDAGSPNSAQMSEYEDAESDNHQARSRYHPVFELHQYDSGPMKGVHLVDPGVTASSHINHFSPQIPQAVTPKSDFYPALHTDKTGMLYDTSLGLTFGAPGTDFDNIPWDEALGPYTGFQGDFQHSLDTGVPTMGDIHNREASTFGGTYIDDLVGKQNGVAYSQGKDETQLFNANDGSLLTSDLNSEFSIEGMSNYHSLSKQSSLNFPSMEGEGLKKYDSFSRWMSKELGEVDHSHIKSSFDSYWSSTEGGNIIGDSSISNPDQLDAYAMPPSVSQDQLFSIVDFSPNWAFTHMETKVLVTGFFLKDNRYLENWKWSCMFGEVEVPAEILADGVLRCCAPAHKAGRVPFYITSSNRLACSEVREFEYRVSSAQDLQSFGLQNVQPSEMHFQTRLEKLLSSGPVDQSMATSSISEETLRLVNKISSLLKVADDEWLDMLKLTQAKGFSPESTQDQLIQNLLKERLHNWLVSKIVEDGKGPNVLDKEGQGVLHLAAALGYDWAIKPTIVAGVSINFRDVRGWTALHWAAASGREHTVISVISLGADPGALTDPTPEFPSGRTPADLASGNGHKGIAGFLAESSLTSHLSTLTLKDTGGGINIPEVSGVEDVENIAEQNAIRLASKDMQDSLKDSLSAVRNASLAAARIHQVYRVHSFQRKKLVEYDDDKCGMSAERALSVISVKTSKSGQRDVPVHAAAVRIQNKFRGWKGRKDFLITRQRIVKIQAHIRGHQVRKRYKKIVCTVGIVEKIILRWRRRGTGLRGFRSEDPGMTTESVKEDEYDFLQEGKRQTEARLDKALARVKSMVHYPEARDQYRRLMTAMQERNLIESEEAAMEEAAMDGDFMMELEGIWEDDPLGPAP